MIERFAINPNNNLKNITSNTTTTSIHPTTLQSQENISDLSRSSNPSQNQSKPKNASKSNDKPTKRTSKSKEINNTKKSTKSNHQNKITNTTSSLSDNDTQNHLIYIQGTIPSTSLINQESNSDMDVATEEIESTG
eukprot:175317_1